jgi:multiple antibiotic resistance protein
MWWSVREVPMDSISIKRIFEAFLVLFVAIDLPGMIPLYMSIVQGMTLPQQTNVLRQAILWAAVIGTGFFLAGNLILAYLGITVADFQIAGGLLLVALSLYDLVSGGQSKISGVMVGVVPLAIPLIVGPAVMTIGISLIQAQQSGPGSTIIAFILNLLLLWVAGGVGLRYGVRISGLLMAGSKVVTILLAAVGVNMVLKGLTALGIIAHAAAGAGR